MKSIEYLTALVLAKRSLNRKLGEETVLWADLVLAEGYESAEIKNLAQHDLTASQAQIESQVDVCFSKLGIQLVDEKSAHTLLVWVWAQKLLKADLSADDFLETMQKLCVDFGHEPVYMQFYLLHCAQKDVAKGKAIVFHDREINQHNFEQVLHWEIDLFVEQNEENILKWIQIKDEK